MGEQGRDQSEELRPSNHDHDHISASAAYGSSFNSSDSTDSLDSADHQIPPRSDLARQDIDYRPAREGLILAALARGEEDKVKMSVILCTAGYDHTIRFWEALSGICSRTIPHPDSQVNRLCISPDKRYLAAAGHHTIKLYDIKSTNPAAVLNFEGHTGNITGVAFHCEGKWMVTSSEDGTVKIWDTRTGNVQRDYRHGCPVNDVVIHPNQGELISCDRSGNVRIWDLSENKCSHQLIPEEDKAVASVTVAGDGTLLCAAVSSATQGSVYVWRMLTVRDVTSLVPVTKFIAHGTYITRVLLSPDVRQLATCSADHTARIWSITQSSSSSTPTPLPITDGSANTPDGSPNPHSRAHGSKSPNANMGVDESGTFALEHILDGHQRWVWDCAFSADSAYLVTACSDHYARLWELQSRTVIRQYNGHHRGAVCVALNDWSDTR
ncbi:TOR complex subunit lst8 [Elasticomyces elasticus]|nr:TOR complex subunit lst8 [Elasticomyces elasticus]